MTDYLTTSLVLDELKRLHIAFPNNIGMRSNPGGTAEVYRNGLRGLTGEAVRAAADQAIQNEEYFPKVAKLRELAWTWTKHHAPTPAEQFETDPMWCARCKSRASIRERWRPKVDKHWQPIITKDGQFMLLEPYTRELCNCPGSSAYMPLDGIEPYACRTIAVGRALLLRSVLIADPVREVAHAAD
jgi:hypothetical protein